MATSPPPASARLDELLAETEWLRRLARRLVHEADDADDLAHDAWLIAAQHRPADERPLRPWLFRVLVNRARMIGRSGIRRRRRELNAAAEPPSAADSPQHLIEQLESQRLIAGMVLELAEPYRTVVLLHYVEGLSSAEIGRRLGVPDGTIRWRLKQALDKLRRRLDDHAPERAWLGPLAVIAGRESPIPVTGALVMKKLVIAIAVLLVLLVAAGVGWQWTRDTPPRAPSTTAKARIDGVSSAAPAETSAPVPALPAWVTPSGIAPQRIAGVVMKRGAPVPGAQVELHAPLAVDGVLARVTADRDGRFDLGIRSAARYVVTASAEAHAAAIANVEIGDPRAPADRLVMILGDCTTLLAGRVVDAAGGPIAGARVRRDALVAVEADDDGRFTLCLPARGASVTADADGYAAARFEIHVAGTLRRDLVLIPETIIRGRVIRASDGTPVAGARVLAGGDTMARGGEIATISGDDGRFELTNVPPGGHQLWAIADGLISLSPSAVGSVVGVPAEVTLEVVPTARVEGKVMAGGQPVAGARISLESPSDTTRPRPPPVYTRGDGSFVIDQAPPGEAVVRVDPWRVTSPPTVRVAGPLTRVMVTVAPTASIRGRVTRAGADVAGAEVSCEPQAGPAAVTGRDGRYQLDGLLEGTCRLSAQDDRSFAQGRNVELTGAEQLQIDLELDHAAEVFGVVVDRDGRPVPDVLVELERASDGDFGSSMTDATGAFHCLLLAGGGTYLATVRPGPGSRARFASRAPLPPIDVPDQTSIVRDVRLVIDRAPGTLAGIVVDSHGAPVADALVEARWRADPRAVGGFATATGRTDGSGEFTLTDLVAGDYVVLARSADGSTAAVEATTGRARLRLTLAASGRIEGRLIGFPPAPLVAARMRSAVTPSSHRAVVHDDRYVITGLAPGMYLVGAAGLGAEAAGDTRTVEVGAGQTVRVDLEHRGVGRIEGSVLAHGRQTPIANAICAVGISAGGVELAPLASSTPITSDARGRFTATAPAGRVRVTCFPRARTHSVAAADVELSAGGTATVEVVAVAVERPGADPAPGFDLEPAALPARVWHVDSDGAATALAAGDLVTAVDDVATDHLSPGAVMTLVRNHPVGARYTVTVVRDGGPPTVHALILRPGS